MAEIDSLEIQITASSRAAATAIDALNRKLGTLANSLNFDAPGLEKLDRISGNNIKNLGVGLNALGKGLQSIQSIRRIDFGKIATDVRRLSNIQSGNLQTLGNAMRPLADGINALSKAKVDNANLTNLINSLTRLSNANLGNLNGANFTQLGTSIKEFANAVSGANKVEQSTIAMTNAVAKLAAAGKNIGKVTGALPHLANNLKAFMNTMHEAPQVANETITFAQAIGTLASAGDKTKATASNLKQLGTELKNFMQTMSTAPNVSDSVIRMTTALSGLVNQGGRVTLSSNSLSSSFSRVSGMSGRLRTNLRNLTGSMSGLSGATSKTASSFKGFLRQLMSATGVYFSIYGAIRGLKSAIDISSDLTEVQNVVDVAFGNMAYKVEEFAKVSVKDFGMSELTTKEIAGRFQAMSTAIGVSADKIGQANTFLSGQTKGYVAVSDSMADVSINLTKLAADMASFYNVEQTDVAKSLESIFTGTTAPLRKYGLDLTQATLAEWAMKQGLDADIRSMSQAEKTMLRYQYVLSNTKAAQGDFARTADSWANQTRVLAQQFEILASVIGGVFINAFKPVVKTLNAVMEKVISFAKTVADALGTIFGWTFEVNPGGMTNDFGDMSSGIEDVADSAGNAADKVKDTTDEVKDLKANLQGFDKLNVISVDKDKDKGGTTPSSGSGGGPGTGGLGGIGGLDTNLFEVDSVMKKYKSSIDTLYKLGEYIGDTLTKALNNINWDKVYAAADNFGIGLAQFLNGLISPELFAAVGQTIAGALNTALHALDNFGATFDWKNLGDSLSAGLVAFLKGIDWETALSAAANWGTGIATTLNNFISPEIFGLVGESIAKALNTAVQFALSFGQEFDWTNFGESLATGVNEFFINFNFENLAEAINVWAKGILDTMITFLDKTEWYMIGERIGTFLAELDFTEIGGKVGQAIWKAINAGIELFKGMFSVAPIETTFLSIGLAAAVVVPTIAKIASAFAGLKTTLAEVSALFSPITSLFAEGGIFGTGGAIATASAPVIALTAAFAAFVAGLGYVFATNEEVRDSFDKAVSSIKEGMQPAIEFVANTLLPDLSSAWDRLVKILTPFGEFLEGMFTSVWQDMINPALTYIGETVLPKVTEAFENLWNNILVPLGSFLGDVLEPVIKTVSDVLTILWENVVVPLADAIGNVLAKSFEGLCDVFNFVVEAVQPVIDIIQFLWDNVLSPIAGFLQDTFEPIFKNVFERIGGIIDGLSTTFGGLIDFVTGVFSADWEKAWNGVKGIFSGVFENLIPELFGIGVDLISGLLDGVISLMSNIGGWLKENVTDPFVNGFKSLFGIHSPSTVMKEQGGYITAGLLEGINGGESSLINASKNIKDKTIGAWNSDDAKKSGKSLVDGIYQGILDGTTNIDEWINSNLYNKFSDAMEKSFGKGDSSAGMKKIGESIIKSIENGMKSGWKNTLSWWKTNAKLPEIKAKVEDIKKKVADEWKKVTNYWKKKELEITSKFKTTKENVNAWWEKVKKWWGEKNLAIKNEFKTTSENVSSWWNTLVKLWGDKKLSVKNDFKTTSENVASWWSKILKWWGKRNLDVRSAFKTTKENVVSWWTKVKNWWGSRIVAVKTEYKTTKETVQKWGTKTVSWLKSGISSAWADFSSWFTEKMKKLMNGAINGMNWVLKGVGSKTRVPVWKGYARGADGLPRNTVGMVNDQKGSTYRELIVPPNGKPFVPEGRNVLLPMKKGTKILPADKTKQLLEIIPHFAKGIGDFSGSIFDYLDKPKEILKIGLDKHMDLSGLTTPILDIASGMKKLFSDNGTDFIKKELDKAITVNYKVGAGVKQWSGLAAKALQITGQYSAANLSYLLQQMHHESRGNPNAINLWDSNAKKGTPSKGLMQVIDPTFRANAKPPYNKNIYDPLSNMIAAINYTVKRYGSLYKGWAARGFKGYAEGIGKITLSDVIPGYATGGFPTSGQLFMARENGIPEMVGKIGNRTAVANNEQITDAVAKSLSVKLGDTTKQLEDIMNALAKSIQKSFEDAENKSGVDKKAINEEAGKVSKELSSTLSSVEKQFSETGEVSRNEMQSLLSKTKETIEQTKAQSSENAAALSSIYQDISTMASSAFDKLEQTAKSYNDYAKKAVKETEYKADIEVEIDSGLDDEAYEAGQNAVSSFSEGMQNYISDMEGWVNDMRDAAANGFSGVADQMQIYGYDAMNGYDYGIGSGYDDLADTVYNAASSVSDGFSGIEADVVIDGSNVITGLQEGMTSQWETLTEWLNERKEELSASLYEIGDYMRPIGERIVSELLAGIESLWSSVEEWSSKLKDAFSAAQEIAASLEQEQTKVSAASSKSKVSEAASSLKTNTKQYKEAGVPKTMEFSKYQQTATSKQYNKYSTQAGNDIKNQNARDMSVSMITAMNQVLVPALQKIGNTTVELKGDAKGLFDAVVKENSKYKTITGASAMR